MMFMVIMYLIAIITFYITFFALHIETRNNWEIAWDDKSVDVKKVKYPVFVWVVSALICLVPILNFIASCATLSLIVVQWFVNRDERTRIFVKLPKFLKFLTKKY